MITTPQIRAARALLGWKQGELAKASGVSVPAIARLELGIGHARSDTLDAIQKAFETNGVEFNADIGVNLRKEIFKIDIFDGADAMHRIWDDVVATFREQKCGELLMSGMDERIWIKLFGDKLDDEIKRRRKAGIKPRLLIKEGDNLCLGSDDVYRCVPESVFGQTPYFVYADKYALINWGPPLRIVLIRSQSVADTFRKQFDFNWKLGAPVENPRVLYPVMD
ncbi:MAG: helix-turn-helix transcriptional regulator [Alphaproteobacteria bacterium]|nr:helix-turn-helix transcriptional regulator [Alphaproteobacteria bacterium]